PKACEPDSSACRVVVSARSSYPSTPRYPSLCYRLAIRSAILSQGSMAGAADYLTKPFDFHELLTRSPRFCGEGDADKVSSGLTPACRCRRPEVETPQI